MSSGFSKSKPFFPFAGREGQFVGSKVRGLMLAVEKVDDELIGGHHDGSVGDLAH